MVYMKKLGIINFLIELIYRLRYAKFATTKKNVKPGLRQIKRTSLCDRLIVFRVG